MKPDLFSELLVLFRTECANAFKKRARRYGRGQPVSTGDLFFNRRIAGGFGACRHVDLRAPDYTTVAHTAALDKPSTKAEKIRASNDDIVQGDRVWITPVITSPRRRII